MVDTVISVVSGTYNRIKYLQAMVASVRASILSIPCEIIIVDGGSTDGTIEWCKAQPDINLIEQGELLGAIKAFNAGAQAAKGTYTILANDDITFVDESITNAFTYMQDNPVCGIGCFWQDRDGKPYHVEQMPAISKNNTQVHVYYGQVCIIPTWLGNYVGWWGDYNHTYGGDNEMSCHVHELGFAVSPVPCACIHDGSRGLNDELRKINNHGTNSPADAARRGKPHPDSIRWREKWLDGTLIGPKINSRTMPDEERITVDRHMRILYAPIYERGHQVQRLQKRGLRQALQRYGLVHEHDYLSYSMDDFLYTACAFKPDLIVTQIQNVTPFTEDVVRELRNNNPNAILVNWNGDYHPENLYNPRYMRMMAMFDKCGFVTTSISDEYKRHNIDWFYWQIGYEESDAEPTRDTPRHDIVFLGNGYSAKRQQLAKLLRNIHHLSVGLYGSWEVVYRPDGNTLYDFDAGRRLYRAAKLTISDSQWPVDAKGFVSNRLFQAMEAGNVLMLQQWFDGMEELLGLQDGVHLVVWHDWHDLMQKIKYYIEHDDERQNIASAGTQYVRTHHSFDARVRELFHEISH